MDGSKTSIAQSAKGLNWPPGPCFLASGDSYTNSAVLFLSSGPSSRVILHRRGLQLCRRNCASPSTVAVAAPAANTASAAAAAAASSPAAAPASAADTIATAAAATTNTTTAAAATEHRPGAWGLEL